MQGEAAFVLIREALGLVALLASCTYGENVDYPTRIVPLVFKLNTFDASTYERLPSLQGRRELPDKWLPTLVLVSDPNDPAALRVIRPDDFDQAFGPGVRLRGVTIEMTTDTMTHGIDEHLPFLIKGRENRYLVYTRPNMFTPNYSYFARSW